MAEAEADFMVEAVIMEEEEVILVIRIRTKVHMEIKVITTASSRAIFVVDIAKSLGTKRLSADPNKGMRRNQILLKM